MTPALRLVPALRLATARRVVGLVALLGLAAAGTGCASRAPAADGPAPETRPAESMPAAAAAGLNGLVWVQHGAGYRAASLQAFVLAEQAMRRALEDDGRTAALEQEGRDVSGLAPAVVLDVDETVLDNSPYEARRIRAGLGFTPESWAAWVREAAARPVPGALAFTRTADRLGVEVFYVTNRDHELEPPTRRNLRRLGFPLDTTADHVLTRGEREGWGSDKSSRRARVARDHRVLVLVGDDLNDFVDARGSPAAYRRAFETHRERFGASWIMLPNPSYGSWEGAATGFESGLSPEESFRRKLRSLRTEEPERDDVDGDGGG